MSMIREAIEARCREGRLCSFETGSVVRDLFVVPEIDQLLAGGDESWVAAEYSLGRFVKGELVLVRKLEKRRDKDGSAFMVRLHSGPGEPAEIWEVRITGIKPQIRIFGRFADKDCFVALAWRGRFRLHFPEAMIACDRSWRELFGAAIPHAGRYPDDYLSNADFVP